MSSRHQPLNGADSDYTRTPFHVLVEDTDGGRAAFTVNAMGRHEARLLAIEEARDRGYDVVDVLEVKSV